MTKKPFLNHSYMCVWGDWRWWSLQEVKSNVFILMVVSNFIARFLQTLTITTSLHVANIGVRRVHVAHIVMAKDTHQQMKSECTIMILFVQLLIQYCFLSVGFPSYWCVDFDRWNKYWSQQICRVGCQGGTEYEVGTQEGRTSRQLYWYRTMGLCW